MKERISISVDDGILKKIDSLIDGIIVKDRNNAIERLLTKAIGLDRPKTGVILAGGMGTRLKPITTEIPKPLVPVQGKPILEHNIELLRLHDIKDIIISIGYKGEMIREYFGDGRKFGVNIFYVEEKEPLGTAGPLRLAEALLQSSFVLMNGDELKDIDLFEMFHCHKEHHAWGTIALTEVADPVSYGCAKLDGEKILAFIEKPSKGKEPSSLINSGLYILEPDVIGLIPNKNCSIEKEIFPKLAEKGVLYGFKFNGQWFDTGTFERLETAIQNWNGYTQRRLL
ncbi:MAG: nucleotidyltransferase family protein [Nanoarchaeota archaeon]